MKRFIGIAAACAFGFGVGWLLHRPKTEVHGPIPDAIRVSYPVERGTETKNLRVVMVQEPTGRIDWQPQPDGSRLWQVGLDYGKKKVAVIAAED